MNMHESKTGMKGRGAGAASWLLLAGLAISPLLGNAQVPAGTPPKVPDGPLLAKPPEFCQWVLTYTYAPERAAREAGKKTPDELLKLPRTYAAIKTGKIVSEQITDVSGGTMVRYQVNGHGYAKRPGDTVWMGDSAPWAETFPGLDWVNAQTYAGTIPYGNSTCLVFVEGGAQAVDLSDPKKQEAALKKQPRVAYIDATTRLPIAVRFPGGTEVYQFANQAPTQAQALPPDLAQVIQKGAEAVANLNRPPPRPY
jgi:hypothetical protein